MDIFGIIKNLGGKLFGIVDKAVVDKDQKRELELAFNKAMLDFISDNESEISKRHEMDMKSDSWLSKNVRPITLVFLLVMFVFISMFDGNVGQFTINETYIPVYEILLSLAFTFYFGSRGFEKATKIYVNRNEKDTK